MLKRGVFFICSHFCVVDHDSVKGTDSRVKVQHKLDLIGLKEAHTQGRGIDLRGSGCRNVYGQNTIWEILKEIIQ